MRDDDGSPCSRSNVGASFGPASLIENGEPIDLCGAIERRIFHGMFLSVRLRRTSAAGPGSPRTGPQSVGLGIPSHLETGEIDGHSLRLRSNGGWTRPFTESLLLRFECR